jgi:hypothetical protein
MLDARGLDLARLAVAGAGVAWLLWDLMQSRSQQSQNQLRRRDDLLVVVGALSFACWWNLGAFHHPRFVHFHEFAHYYLGAKYHDELGFTRLYQCIVAADAENGGRSGQEGWVRNLETNVLEPAPVALSGAAECRSRFAPERWTAFRSDVQWFRARFSDARWRRLLADHGYNATPVWTAAGSLLANAGPASPALILALALIDPVLYLAMWAVVWRTFGWRTTCVALIWWGTNYPARYSYIGGAFLRGDWLALLVTGICLLRLRYTALAGAALGWSSALRVFPAVILAGPALRGLWPRAGLARPGQMRALARLFAGAGGMVAVLVVITSLLNSGRPGDLHAWRSFAHNSGKHLGQASTNRMGLKVALAFEPETRFVNLRDAWMESPLDTWHGARARVFRERRWAFWAALAAYLTLLLFAVRRLLTWESAVVAAGLPVIAFELACYYYGFLLVFAFLWPRRRWIGLALAILGMFSSIPPLLWTNTDDIYVAESVLSVVFVAGVTLALAFGPRALDPVDSSLDAASAI